MRPWQLQTLDQLRENLPHCAIEPYGSTLAPESLDGWSDVDARIRGDIGRRIEDVLDAEIWASQEARTQDGHQVLRLVLLDGRRLDLTIDGAPVELADPVPDVAQRFDAALAAVRFGRGNDLIGLHLTLGILREALVQPMLLADRAEGTAHHRTRTPWDGRAGQAASILQEPYTPDTALSAYELWASWHAEVASGFVPSPEGLRRVIERGKFLV